MPAYDRVVPRTLSAGLVDRRQEGTFVYYSVREEAMNHLATLLAMGRPGVPG